MHDNHTKLKIFKETNNKNNQQQSLFGSQILQSASGVPLLMIIIASHSPEDLKHKNMNAINN